MADYSAVTVGVEGVVIKPLGDPYKPGKRGWLKLRLRHTVEASSVRSPEPVRRRSA
jgi:ATP-dependent DNA ligase